MTGVAEPEEIRCIALGTGEAELLLPNVAVAEVVGFRDPTPYDAAPVWLLGTLPWRGVAVPVVSLAMASEEPAEVVHGYRSRLVISYTPSGNGALPYVGIAAVGPPRLTRLSPGVLEPVQGPRGNPFVLHALIYAERLAWIPNLDALERAVLEVMPA